MHSLKGILSIVDENLDHVDVVYKKMYGIKRIDGFRLTCNHV